MTGLETRPRMVKPSACSPADPGPGPMRVVHIDADKPIPDIEPGYAAGGRRYEAAWILARRGGVPIGQALIPFADGPLTGEQVLADLRATLGDSLGADVPTPPSTPDDELPFATVVVPTLFAREGLLVACIDSLRQQDYPAFEILLVDNRPASPHAPPPFHLAEDRLLRIVREPRRGAAAARNRGIALASGSIIAFTDDDVRVDADWLRRLCGRLVSDPEADAVKGPTLPTELETAAQVLFQLGHVDSRMRRFRPACYHIVARDHSNVGRLAKSRFQVIERAAATDQKPESLYATSLFGNGYNMAFRAEALASIGGFDDALGIGTCTHGGEDLALFINLLFAGGCVAFEPTAVVHHSHRRTYAELERQIAGYGVGLTAMFMSLIRRDKRHLIGLCRVLVRGALAMTLRLGRREQPDGKVGLPREIARAELIGMVKGPAAYVRSRRCVRRAGT